MDGAFFIGGHGGEHNRTFVVPDGCIIIVHVHYGEKIDRDEHLEILKKLYQLKQEGRSDILRDPLNHIPALLEIYQRFAVYQAGESCPDFRYQLFDCLSSTVCYEIPMGVVDLDAWDGPEYSVSENKLRKPITPNKIKHHFSNPYEYSIYPTKNQVEIKVQEITEQVAKNQEESSIRNVIEQKPRSLLRAIFKGISDYTDTTQSELCDFRKGVYYHSVCRQKKDITSELYSSIISIPQVTRHVNQVRNRPLSVSHTRKKANNYVSLKKGVSNALKHRIGETLKHRTPYIKQWMNSPVYRARRREEVRQEIQKIESYIGHQTRLVESYQEAVDRRKAAQLSDSLTSEERAALEKKQKEAQKYVNQYKKPLNKLRKNHNVLRDLERSLHE
jgi:hypothetical protein